MQKTSDTKREVGYIVSTQDYLVFLEGLPSAQINDIVVTKNGSRGLVAALSKDKVEAWMLDPERPKPGEYMELSDKGLQIPLGTHLTGRMINPLGQPLDGRAGFPPTGVAIDLDVVAPGIDTRKIVSEQFYIGLTMIDTLIPIGKGQRELLFGEARSGKSSFIVDAIVHQKHFNRICVYSAIGRSEIDTKRLAEQITEQEGDKFTVIVAATSSESAPMIAICPAIACSVAEQYRDQGRDVLLILDDLATHAKYLREISLLAGRIPGRESYPADIFYQHSHLVERAGNFNEKYGNGSITLLPVIETDLENITSLIPTNVMSMTDGHVLFSASLRAQGVYPAIEPDRSVTRVGRQTQFFLHKVLSDRVRSLLADYHELERYGRFGSELTGETQLKIKRGKITEELLKQDTLTYIEPSVQILLLALVFTGYFDGMDIEAVRTSKKKVIRALTESPTFKDLSSTLKDAKLDELITKLKEGIPTLEEACRQLQT